VVDSIFFAHFLEFLADELRSTITVDGFGNSKVLEDILEILDDI
jgi:hypothetical protein